MANDKTLTPRRGASRRAFLSAGVQLGAGLALADVGLDLAPRHADASGTTTLTYMGLKDNGNPAVGSQLMRLFEQQNPGVKTQFVSAPPADDAFLAKAITILSSRDASVDIFDADVTWPAQLGAAGWIADLNSYLPPKAQKNYVSAMTYSDTIDGHLRGIPWMLDTGHLYYRKDILAANNLKPAKTWPELVQQCIMLQKKYAGMVGFVGCFAQGQQQLISMFLEFIHSNDGDWIDSKTGKVVLNSPQNVAALQFMVDMVNKYKIMQPGILSMNLDTGRTVFTEGRAVYHRNWNYVYALAEDAKGGSKVAGKVGVTAVPFFPGHKTAPSAGGWQYVVNNYSKNRDMAIKLALFMGGAQGQKFRAIHGSFSPAYLPDNSDPQVVAAHPGFPLLAEQGAAAVSRGKTPYYTQASTACEVELSNALTGQKSVRRALADASSKITNILSGQA